MIMAKLKSAKGKKFLFGLLAVFIIMASVVTRATIGGVIEQYNIPLSGVDDINVCDSVIDDFVL